METIKNEYYVAYIVPSKTNVCGHFVAESTDLKGKELVEWLYQIAEDQEKQRGIFANRKEDILILAIQEVGSWVVEVE